MKISIARFIIIAYFIMAIIEVFAEATNNTLLIVIFKPLLPTILILLYVVTSPRRNVVFVITMSLSLMTNLLFIPNTEQMLFYGIIIFLIHRLYVIYLIITLVQIKDFIPLVIGTVPFLLIFVYLFMISDDIPENSFMILIFQNLLISVLGGIAVSTYIMKDSKTNSWLLLCGLLFVLLHLIVFVEKYYLSQLSPALLRPVAMGLNVIAFYTFYEFVLTAERSNDYSTAAGGNSVAG